MTNAYRLLKSVDILQRTPFIYLWHGIHPLQAKDRLGNPEIDFPIGIAYAERDFLSTDNGAEQILQKNKHFKSGRS